MSDVPGKQGLYGLNGDAQIRNAKTGTVNSTSLICFAGLFAVFGLLSSVSVLLNAHKPLYTGLSLLALALACFSLWLIWRVLKHPIPAAPNPAPLLLFPAIASDAIPQMIRVLGRGRTLDFPYLLEAAGLIVGLLSLCFGASGFRSLRKGAA